MADPRDDIRQIEIGVKEKTYKIDDSTITYDSTKTDGSSQVGLAVTFLANKTVKLTEDAEFVLGKLKRVTADKKCAVATVGTMTLPGGNGATLTRGQRIVGDLGAASAKGYIREVATAVAAELGVARGFIEDDDATNPVVTL